MPDDINNVPINVPGSVRVSVADSWLVWSYEHEAWWGPGRRGYSRSIVLAGLYTQADAKGIEADANRYRRVPYEQAVPLIGAADPLSPNDIERSYFAEAIRDRDALVRLMRRWATEQR